MILTQENYHSKEANQLYMGASQFKSFMECQARAMAEINETYVKDSSAFVEGHYIDSHFEGTLNIFKAKHPELFKKNGDLQKKYECLNTCIQAIENDEKMLYLCSGEQQKIMTGIIAGVPFKIMIDSYLPEVTVDRKAMKDFDDIWKNGEKLPWWKAYGYDYQGAIYIEIRRQNEEGVVLPFDLVAISKKEVPDKRWLRFMQDRLEEQLCIVKHNAPKFQMIKEGLIDPEECGICEYCISNKKLIEPEII